MLMVYNNLGNRKIKMVKTKESSSNLKRLLIPVLVVLLVVTVITTLLANRSNNNQKSPNSPDTNSGINLDPPTETDLEETDQHKQEIIDRQNSIAPPSGVQKAVTPIITFAEQADNQIEVGSYVPGIFESGGTCTLTITKSDINLVKQESGVKDATTTRCPTFTVARSEFPHSGTWSAQVSYESATAKGESELKSIEVR